MNNKLIVIEITPQLALLSYHEVLDFLRSRCYWQFLSESERNIIAQSVPSFVKTLLTGGKSIKKEATLQKLINCCYI